MRGARGRGGIFLRKAELSDKNIRIHFCLADWPDIPPKARWANWPFPRLKFKMALGSHRVLVAANLRAEINCRGATEPEQARLLPVLAV